MSDAPFDERTIRIRCPKCGNRYVRSVDWVESNATMQCAGCGVTIRLDRKPLPPATPREGWWRSPWGAAYAAAVAAVAGIAIGVSLSGFWQWPATPAPPPVAASVPPPASIPIPAAPPAAPASPVIQAPTQPAPIKELDFSDLSRPQGAVCPQPIENGDTIGPVRYARVGVHSINISNGSEGNAIVNILDATTETVIVSFFVASGQMASADGFTNGLYRAQWALGDVLGPDCTSFVHTEYASEFDKPIRLAVTFNANGDMMSNEVTFTLYTVPHGNARSHSIPLAKFYAR